MERCGLGCDDRRRESRHRRARSARSPTPTAPISTARWQPPSKGFAHLAQGLRLRPLRRSCARPPTLLRERADDDRPADDHGAGQAAGRGQGAKSLAGADVDRLVRRGSPPRLWPRDPRPRPRASTSSWSRSRSARSPPSRRGISRSTRSCANCPAALAAGCSIIVKAPEETPASPAELIRGFADAGVPAGVINLVYGVPAEISEYLIPHPIIRKISFTGSTAGRQASGRARRRST